LVDKNGKLQEKLGRVGKAAEIDDSAFADEPSKVSLLELEN